MSEIKPGLFRHLTPDTGDCVSFLRQLSSDERMFADSIPPGVIADVEKTMRHKRAERYEAWAVGIDEQQSKYEAAHEALVNTENDLARCREVANNQRGRIADLERQIRERDAALARCVGALRELRGVAHTPGGITLAAVIDDTLAFLPASAQATAKVLAAARWVAYVTTSKVDDPQGQADAMHDALTELAEAIREEKETK